MTHRWRSVGLVAVIGLAVVPSMALSRDSNQGGIRFGPGALTFSAGAVRMNVEAHGYIVRTYDDRQLVGKGDYLYVKMAKADEVNLGSRYTVYRRVHKVFHPRTARYLGDLVNILGTVRIMAIDGDIATASIERSYNSIAPGDAVTPFEPPPKAASGLERLPLPESPGTVIDVQVQGTLLAQNQLVYVDWGRDDGLQVGDVVDVFRVRSGFPPRQIGELKVIALEDRTATAQIKRSLIPIWVGDRIVAREMAKDIAHELEMPTRPTEHATPAQPQAPEAIEPPVPPTVTAPEPPHGDIK